MTSRAAQRNTTKPVDRADTSGCLYLSRHDADSCGAGNARLALDDVRHALDLMLHGRVSSCAETSFDFGSEGRRFRLYQLGGNLDQPRPIAGQKVSVQPIDAPRADDSGSVTVTLFDPSEGRPVAILDGAAITYARTVAIAALAARRFSPEPIAAATILGTGRLARCLAQSLPLLLPTLTELHLWGRRPALSRSLKDAVVNAGLAASVHADSVSAVRAAPVCFVATGATEPYITAEHLGADLVLCHLGRNDLHFAAIEQFDEIIVDAWSEACSTSEQSLFQMWRDGRISAERVVTLGDCLRGSSTAPLRRVRRRVLFDSFGLVASDLVIADRVVREAQARGLGIPLPRTGHGIRVTQPNAGGV